MTEKIFYLDSEKYIDNAVIIDIKGKEDYLGILTDKTIFYPEGGGQPSDKGIIKGKNWILEVLKVEEINNNIWHYGILKGEFPKKNEEISLEIDINLRREYSQEHSAQHLFSAILEKDYDYKTTGFQILDEHTKIEIPLSSEINFNYIKKSEEKVNKIIMMGIPIFDYWIGNKRIIEILNYDKNPCGGLHVKNTKDIGLFKVLKIYRKNSQYWRIEFIAGERILKRLEKREMEYEELKRKLGDSEIVPALDKIMVKMKDLEKENKRLKEEILNYKVKEILNNSTENSLGKIVLEKIDVEMNTLKNINNKILEEANFSFIFNNLNQFILSRNKNFPENLWNCILGFIREKDFKGVINDYFVQGKIDEIDNLSEFLKNLFISFI